MKRIPIKAHNYDKKFNWSLILINYFVKDHHTKSADDCGLAYIHSVTRQGANMAVRHNQACRQTDLRALALQLVDRITHMHLKCQQFNPY